METVPTNIRLLADGVEVPGFVSRDRALFIVPTGVREARLLSNTYLARFANPANEDDRPLGIMMTGMTIETSNGGAQAIDLAGDVFSRECYEFEGAAMPPHRWTNGDAHLSAVIWPESQHDMLLEVRFSAAADLAWSDPNRRLHQTSSPSDQYLLRVPAI